MSSDVRVLVACPFVPWPLDSGGRIRTHHLVREAAKAVEVELHMVEEPRPDMEDARAILEPLVERLVVHPRSASGVLARLARPKLERWFHSASLEAELARRSGDPALDLIHLDEPALARRTPRGVSTPTLVHHAKLETVLADSLRPDPDLAARFDRWKLGRLERDAARRHRHHLTCSREDAEILRARYPHLSLHVLPSGFDPNAFAPDPATPAPDAERLVFVGSLDYGPNIDGLTWFVTAVWPRLREARPGMRLDVVGKDPTNAVQALAGNGIELLGRVEDVRPHLARATVVVVPLRIGGGTRLKIVEALALERPLVSTTIGAEGLGLEHGRHVMLADDAASFAHAVLELTDDPDRAQRLARGGAEAVRARFPWPRLAQELVEIWREVARSGL